MASISFPTSPSNGDTYTFNGVTYEYNSAKSQWIIQTGTTLADVNINAIGGNMVPSANVTYDLGTADSRWRDLYLSGSSLNLGSAQLTADGNSLVLPEGSSVGNIAIGAGGATVYANTSSLPKSDLTAGNFAFVGNTLFITNGTGWYSVGVTNQSPSLTLSTSSISLGASGNTINFTYTASDPDGPTPTVTMTTTANTSQANVTLYTSNSTVTVENLSATDYSANIVLTATDGIDQTFGTATLTVAFAYVSELWDETVLSIGTSSTNSLNNSTFIDRSTNAHTVTTLGSPIQTAFHPYLDNWSVEFDGNDYINTGNATNSDNPSATLTFGVDKTIEFFIYMPNLPADASGVIGASNGGGSQPKWSMFVNTNTSYTYQANRIMFASNSGGTSQNFEVVWESNRWYHIAWVWDQSTSTSSLYVDGTRIGTGSYEIDRNISTPVDIGSDGEQYKYFSGSISNVRILNGTALYSGASITVPTENLTAITDTTLLTCQSNRFADNSTLNNSFTISGDPKVSALNPFGQESEYAIGENKGSMVKPTAADHILSCPAFSAGDTDFTVEFWAWFDASSSRALTGQWGTPRSWVVYIENTSMNMSHSESGSNYVNNPSSISIIPNEWNHFVFQKKGTNKEYFLNGQPIAQHPFSNWASSANNVDVGRGEANYNTWAGKIADYRITLSAVYDYSTGYTVPSSPVGNTNGFLYLPMDNAGIFDKTGNHDLTLSDAVTSTTQTKYASSVLSIEGTGNRGYVNLPSSTSLLNANDIVTIEGWVYFSGDTSGDNVGFIGSGLHNFPSRWVIDLAATSGNISPRIVGVSNNPLTNGTPISAPTQQWHHIAVVNNPNDNYFKVYINGTISLSTTAQSQTLYNGRHEIGAGGGTSSVAGGEYYIENFQILKGVAKYTANFTPPTSTQGREYQAES